MHALSRVILASAAASVAASSAALAQSPALGSPVSATGAFAGEDALDRAALFTQSAFVMPQGRFGFTVQGVGSSHTLEQDGTKLELRGAGAVFSANYGLTSAITLGAGLPYMSMTSKFSVAGIGAESSIDGLGDVELFGRLRAFRSASGSTRMALGAGVSLPTGDEALSSDDPTYQVGGSMSHRTNRITYHVAPAVRLVKDFDPSFDVNVAASYAATPKLALSVEGLSRFEGGASDAGAERTRMMDIGAGMRYRAVDNVLLDLGLRSNVSNNIKGVDSSAGNVVLGMSYIF
jgi:hypothetical protein